MNSVSWFIYVAQVANSIGILFCVTGVSIAIAAGVFSIFNMIENDRVVVPKGWAAVAIGFLIVGNLMPEKNTMYAIAASQVGEQVVKSETAQGIAGDATKALQQWIKKQIDPEAKK